MRNSGAVIIAAGDSVRMGGSPKALLPILEESLLERVIGLFEANDVEHIVVVLGHHSPLISPLLENLKVPWVKNNNPEEGMFSSVRLGVESLSDDVSSFFLLPVDVPLIPIDLPSRLLTLLEETNAPIAAPSINRRRGHPPLFDGSLRQEILDFCGDGGLRAFQQTYLDETAWLLTDEADILLDMDTPDDYEQIQRRAREVDEIPTVNEIELFLQEQCCDSFRKAHGLAVANLALKILERLENKGKEYQEGERPAGLLCLPSKELLRAAALMHDVAKGGKTHDKLGAVLARKKGWHSVAALIRNHMNLHLPKIPELEERKGAKPTGRKGPKLNGRALLFLADKAVKGDEVVGIEKNFSASLERFKSDKEARSAIEKRMESAHRILELVEEYLGPLNYLH